MVHYEVLKSQLKITGPRDYLGEIRQEYSFANKATAHQLHRLAKKYEWKKAIHALDESYLAWHNQQQAKLKAREFVYCAEWVDDETLIMPVGLLSRIQQRLTDVPHTFLDTRDFDLPAERLVGESKSFRPPQQLAFDLVTGSDLGCGMVRMATGVGKTLVGQEIIRHYGLRSLFLVPSQPILNQTYNRFRYAFGRRNVGTYSGKKKKLNYITVATYQSIYAADEDEFKDFDLVICDEVHHVGAETFFEVVTKRLRHATRRYGLTADEERSDGGTILVEAATGPVLYSYDAPEAIRDQYLAKPTFIIYEVMSTKGTFIEWKEKDDKRVAVGVCQSQCFTEADHHMAQKNWVIGNDKLTQFFAGLSAGFAQDGKSVLILVDEKEHGEKFVKLLEPTGVEFGFVIGGGKDNEEIIGKFNERKIKILIGTSTIGEGADTVPVNILINLMGGKRPKQANGRALRNDPDPETNIPRKPTCLIIDIDFPLNPTLHSHCLAREEIHQECGEVQRQRLF